MMAMQHQREKIKRDSRRRAVSDRRKKKLRRRKKKKKKSGPVTEVIYVLFGNSIRVQRARSATAKTKEKGRRRKKKTSRREKDLSPQSSVTFIYIRWTDSSRHHTEGTAG